MTVARAAPTIGLPAIATQPACERGVCGVVLFCFFFPVSLLWNVLTYLLRLGVGDGREMDCLSLQSCCRVALCRCVLCAWLCDWRQRVVVWMISSECAGRRAGRGRPTPLDGCG